MQNRTRRLSRVSREARNGFAFIAPWIIGFLLFYLIPFVFAVRLSFSKDVMNMEWVGAKNYIFLLTQSSRFWVSFRQTLLWTLAATVFTAVISICFASLIFKKFRFQTLVRTIFYLPVVINALATATVVRYLTRENGWINGLIQMLGGEPVDFWVTPSQVFFTILVAQIFSVGGTVVVYLAGLSAISSTYYEAARIDGAGSVAIFFKVTLPLLSSTIYFNVITSIIFIFGSMNVPLLYYGFAAKGSSNAYVGGPGDVVYHLGLHVYNLAFNDTRSGHAAAVGVLMFITSFIIVGITYKLGQRLVHYES